MNEIICAKCEHFINSEKRFNKCKAFPKPPGISWKIISGENDHGKKIKGQTGDYIFKEKNKEVKQMPVKRCRLNDKPGWKWGNEGKCYTYTAGNKKSEAAAKLKAAKQGVAVHVSKGNE